MHEKRSITKTIEWIINSVAKYMSLIIIVIMAIITYEVSSRYLFNRPTSWAWLINRQLFGIFILIAGPYTLIQRSHIRIEMLYERFPGRVKTIIRVLSFSALVIFIGALVWQSYYMASDALMMKEKAVGVFPLPMYPFKILIPIFAALFIIAGIPVFLKPKKKQSQ